MEFYTYQPFISNSIVWKLFTISRLRSVESSEGRSKGLKKPEMNDSSIPIKSYSGWLVLLEFGNSWGIFLFIFLNSNFWLSVARKKSIKSTLLCRMCCLTNWSLNRPNRSGVNKIDKSSYLARQRSGPPPGRLQPVPVWWVFLVTQSMLTRLVSVYLRVQG